MTQTKVIAMLQSRLSLLMPHGSNHSPPSSVPVVNVPEAPWGSPLLTGILSSWEVDAELQPSLCVLCLAQR